MIVTRTVSTIAAMLCLATALHAQNTRCTFEASRYSFKGTPVEQALCLLRPVLKGGNLGATAASLPEPLASLIGTRVNLGIDALRAYLTRQNIREADIGGSLTKPVAHANNNDSRAPLATYFVIHDVSLPLGTKQFPANMDSASWNGNNLARWKADRQAHVYVNRLGASTTAFDFTTALRATKREKLIGTRARGLFLHIELVQPRRSDPHGAAGNDLLAPDPGFTDAQYDRLALLYLAASIRQGSWMIPSYHCPLDAGIPNGHDDPQHFDLGRWAERLRLLLASL